VSITAIFARRRHFAPRHCPDNGIPLLDEIQGFGDAFAHQRKKGTRTELIIFIRPQIIRDGTDAHHVAEELRTKLRGSVGASIDDLRVRTVH
jgi:general secretion pathway protein D